MGCGPKTPCYVMWLLLSGSAVLLTGCSPLGGPDPTETGLNNDEALTLDSDMEGTSLFEVVTPQLLEIMPDVEVNELIGEDGEMTLMLNNGDDVGYVGCRCPEGGTGVCVGLYPQDGSDASCSGECDDAGHVCSWINTKPKTDLVFDGDSADLGLDAGRF